MDNSLCFLRRLVAAAGLVALTLSDVRAQNPLPTHNDLVYAVVTNDDGGETILRMDVWEATVDAKRAPLVMWIHGGGWQSGTYNNPPPALQAMLNAGFAVASVQYRLSGAAIFPAQIHDVKGAVRFLRAHADDYGLDASRFAAWGSSAGGHLTGLLATSGGVPELEGSTGGNAEYSSRLQAAIDYFGPTDLLQMSADVTTPPGSMIDHDEPTSAESRLIGFDAPNEGIGVLRANLTNPVAPFPEKAALVTMVNPITHVTADDPPVFIAHGDLDRVVPMNQSMRLAKALDVVDVEHVMRVVVGGVHGFGAQSSTVNAEAIAFLTAQLERVAGDFNDDGEVDAADYLVWKQSFGSNSAAADANGNGFVDAGDYTIWRDNFSVSVISSLTFVPETTTFINLLIGIALLLSIGRGQHWPGRSERSVAEDLPSNRPLPGAI